MISISAKRRQKGMRASPGMLVPCIRSNVATPSRHVGQHPQRVRGISLLVVVIIGSVMFLAAAALGTFALRTLQNSQSREAAVQGVYSAEDAFECVRYWANENIHSFTPGHSAPAVKCAGVTYDFDALTGGTPVPSYSEVSEGFDFDKDGSIETDEKPSGITTFYLPGNNKVEVIRNLHIPGAFSGTIHVYGRNVADTSSKVSERYQEYTYRTIQGADIMFVVDQSGSIGGERADGIQDGEWANLVWALTDSIDTYRFRVPAPQTGVVFFGTDIGTVGVAAGDATECGTYLPGCFRVPDVQLTNIPGSLPDNGTNTEDATDDDLQGINVNKEQTNLSLGLAIAGAELMGKYYPAGAAPALTPANNMEAGWFEQEVTDVWNIDWPTDVSDKNALIAAGTGLVSQPSGGADRDDSEYGDYIILITDGAPNSIVLSKAESYFVGKQLSTDHHLQPPLVETPYVPGASLQFRTINAALGSMVDEDQFLRCFEDAGVSEDPDSILSFPNDENYDESEADDPSQFSRVPMCNAVMIADALKVQGIHIAVIGVGYTPGDAVETFLREDIADAGLYKYAASYADVYNAIAAIIETIILLESR